jgi:hypothetical protein
MYGDGWTEEKASFESGDLVTYIRLNRLMGVLNGWRLREGQNHHDLCVDLMTLMLHIQENVPLPGTPDRIG